MKATGVWFVGPRSVEPRDVEVSGPSPHEVIVETEVSAISAGTELLLYRGEMPPGLAADEALASVDGDLSYPRQYGYATVGEIVETGEDIADAWTGRRVFAFYPHQTRFSIDIQELLPLPGELPSVAAALVPFMETAVTLALDANPRLGERVVLHGAGVIGLCTLYVLSRFPLERVAVVEPIEERRAIAEDLGATRCVSPPPDLEDYDLAIEVSGEPIALDDAVRSVGYDGRVIVGSWYGTKPVELDLGRRFHRDRVRIASSQVSTIRPGLRGRWTRERRLDLALSLLADFPVERVVTHRLPYRDAERAYRTLDRSPEDAIQILLTNG